MSDEELLRSYAEWLSFEQASAPYAWQMELLRRFMLRVEAEKYSQKS